MSGYSKRSNSCSRRSRMFSRPSIGIDLLIPSRHYAAIDVPNGSGHPLGVITEQKVNGLCHIFRRANPTDRMKAVECGKCLIYFIWVNEGLIKRRLDHRRRHGIDPNVVVGQPHRHMRVKACNPAFAIE